ncbi:Hypothetical_protein [Hexamita inflata]|uniref:Hypothetical_protein n=1 Tax=Hexamita inflata TaxID=28002 RepID=A0AA86UL68_9EUKA|nr:Hypothetical protein HINF_LOCUS43262 [Hexamita inflata]
MDLKLLQLNHIRQPLSKISNKNTASSDSQQFQKVQTAQFTGYIMLICKIEEQNMILESLNDKFTTIVKVQKKIDMSVDTLIANYRKQQSRIIKETIHKRMHIK